MIRNNQKSIDWQDSLLLLQSKHAKLVGFVDIHSNDELHGGPMMGANNNWTPGRWAKAAGPSHYRSATKFVRKCL